MSSNALRIAVLFSLACRACSGSESRRELVGVMAAHQSSIREFQLGIVRAMIDAEQQIRLTQLVRHLASLRLRDALFGGVHRGGVDTEQPCGTREFAATIGARGSSGPRHRAQRLEREFVQHVAVVFRFTARASQRRKIEGGVLTRRETSDCVPSIRGAETEIPYQALRHFDVGRLNHAGGLCNAAECCEREFGIRHRAERGSRAWCDERSNRPEDSLA